jgi:hypothetical protein
LDSWSGWSFVAFEPNSRLFEKNETSKISIFPKFGKHQQSRYESTSTSRILQISSSGNKKNTPTDLATRVFRYHNCWARLKTVEMLEILTGFGTAINDVRMLIATRSNYS